MVLRERDSKRNRKREPKTSEQVKKFRYKKCKNLERERKVIFLT